MQSFDNSMDNTNIENTDAGLEYAGDTLFPPENPDDENFNEECERILTPVNVQFNTLSKKGGAIDEPQPPEEEQEKPKRRSRKAAKSEPQDANDDEQPDGQWPEEPAADILDEEFTGESFGEERELDEQEEFLSEDTDTVNDDATRRRQARGLDGYGRVIYERGDRGQQDLSLLTGARNARRILTATIDGIDNDGNALPRVVFFVGSVKVLIPFAEMGMDLNPREIEQGEAARIIDSMLGARVDYMVRGVDPVNRVAVASRRAAMLLRRETILNARRDDVYRIRLGTLATARVLEVRRLSMLVEIYGYQTYIRRNAASNLWVSDIREFAAVGEEKQVEVVELERDPITGEVTHMAVSIRGVDDAPRADLRTGNTYTGNITGFSDTAYFVRVTGVPMEVRCPINSNHVMDGMNIGDHVKFVVRGVYDGIPTGSIRKIIKKAVAGNR